MKGRVFGCAWAAVVMGVMSTCALAQQGEAKAQPEAKLKAGDKAPPLTIEKWVKGGPVTSFEPGKVYVVEFWATWCGPCIASMPHLSALAREYKSKNVTIIGCTSADPNNTLDKVEAMVKEKADGMDYTVAWDKERTTNEAYMKAANQRGIPTSFLIDGKGNIAWIGHPMFLDMPLDMVCSGKWDPKTGPEEIAKAQKALQDVFTKMNTDPKAAIEAWSKLEKDYPKLAHQMADRKFNLYLAAADYENAYKVGNELVDKAIKGKDAMKLNEIAWTIVDPDGDVSRKDLDLAMKAAVKADEFTNGQDAAIVDTLARVHFLKGNVDKAIELQTRAVSLAKGSMKEELEKSLTEYKKKAQE